MRWCIGLVQLTRPDISVLAASYTLVGAYLGSDVTKLLSLPVLHAALVVGLVVSTSFVINAYRDVLVDGLEHPRRPIPSGRVSRRSAVSIALILTLASLGIAATLGPLLAGIALFNLALSALYSYYLKSTLLLGNVIIAFLDASIVIYGSLAAGGLPTVAWVVSLLIFLYILAQEILYTVRDQKGDALAGLRTVTTQWGVAAALHLFQLVALGFIMAALMVWFLGVAPNRYLYAVVPCSVLPIAGIVVLLSRRTTSKHIRIALRVINTVWVLSLLPVLLLK